MSAPGLFRTLRGCIINGEHYRRDVLVRLGDNDRELIGLLLESNKVAPADPGTEKRIRRGAPIKWTAGEPRQDRPQDEAWQLRYPR